MRKKMLSLALALVMCLGLTVPALAADSDFVIENGVLTKYNGPGGDVVIPSGVTSIGSRAFAYNGNVTGVTIPDGVTDIGEGAFRNCYYLTSVTIPASVTNIGESAFYDCYKLTGVTIPNGVTSIGISAFNGTSITSLTIPDSVTSIRDNPFTFCKSLTDISVSSGNQTYTSVDGVLFSKDMTTLISYPEGKQGSYVIPDSVTTIGKDAFAYCEGLTGVTIPNSVTTIGSNAFSGCNSLTSVTIPDSVTSIDSVFFGNWGLTSVTIPASITNMDGAFNRCGALTSVTILDGVTTIGKGAFFDCEELTSITIPVSVTRVLDSAFGYSFGIGLTDVYYGGSKAQWDAVTIGNYNAALKNATIHYNSTGPSVPGASSAPSTPSTPGTSSTGAVLSPQKLTVDGENIDCEKYNIGGSNYFKLRDLAYALNGTGSQFGVGYDEATATVTITTGEAYTPTGTEMATGVDNSSTAHPSSQTIKINGVEHGELTVYNIGGSNFFQLRELGSVLGFEVGYDVDTNTATVTSA